MLHSYCEDTLFCTSCGKSAGWVVEFGDECRDDVLPISHLLAKRRGTWTIERLEVINWAAKQ